MRRRSSTVEHSYREGVEEIPRAVAEHPTYIRRLNWKFGDRVPMDTVPVAESIAQAPPEAVWFIDNNVLDDDVDPAIIEALLAAPGRMVLTPLVMQEARDWLMRHPEHPFMKAIKKGDAKPGEWRPAARGQPGHDVYEYYLALLAIRRNSIKAAELRFAKEHGREPDEPERRAIHTEAQRGLSPRGYMLAKKGPGKLPTDEALAYLAVHHALTTGRPTHILTADGDVEEQFVKLLWLINTHYRGMLIAKRYAADFASFRPRPFPEKFWSASGDELFRQDGAVLIERGNPNLQQYLPDEPHCVAVSCWRIGKYFSTQTFMAEQEMTALLNIKDRTGGLSTDSLGGRNVHPWLGLLPLPHQDAMAAAVVHDKRLPLSFTNVAVPRLDVLLTMGQFESRIQVEGSLRDRVAIDNPGGTPVVYGDLILPPKPGHARHHRFRSH
jgi:hypothetical protein